MGSSEEEWKTLGFVESKASGGTTTEVQTYRYEVSGLKPGTHRFRLQQVDIDGATHLSEVVSVAVEMEEALRLSAPAPNPVRTGARIRFGVREAGEATLRLYNVLGQWVGILYEGTPTPGRWKRFRWESGSCRSFRAGCITRGWRRGGRFRRSG